MTSQKENHLMEGLKAYIKRNEELEAENSRLRKEIEESKREYHKSVKEEEEEFDKLVSVFNNTMEKLVLAKSLINIPDNLKDMFNELVRTRIAYWESVKDTSWEYDDFSWQDKNDIEFVQYDTTEVFGK